MESLGSDLREQSLMKTAICAFISVLVLGGLYFIFVAPGRAVNTRTTRTIAMMTQILNDIDVWNYDDARRYGPLPQSETNSVELNRKVARIFAESADRTIQSGHLASPDGVFRDGWGNPLMFITTNNPACQRLKPDLRSKARPLIIWSAGPNGVDEYGYGDDLFSHL